MTKRPYVPAPVHMNAINRTIAQSIAAVERSCALLSRLDADSTIVTSADDCRLLQRPATGDRKETRSTMGAEVGVRK